MADQTRAVTFIPLNPQEHDNVLRGLIVKHMGSTQGNPTQWVVNAVHEAYQMGFDEGFRAARQSPIQRVEVARPLSSREVLPFVARIEDGEELDG